MQVSVNEEVDPWIVIARLQQEVRGLKEELRYGNISYILPLMCQFKLNS